MPRPNRNSILQKFGVGTWVGIALASVATSVIVYKYLFEEDSNSGDASNAGSSSGTSTSTKSDPKKGPIVKSATKVSLVISKSLLNDGIPIQPLLKQFPELVIILVPEVARDDATMQIVEAQVPQEHEYKVIKCEKTIGVVHLLKHLRPHLAILPHDIPKTTPSDISRFVGAVTVLHNDPQVVHDEIQHLFFSSA